MGSVNLREQEREENITWEKAVGTLNLYTLGDVLLHWPEMTVEKTEKLKEKLSDKNENFIESRGWENVDGTSLQQSCRSVYWKQRWALPAIYRTI